jgi:Transcriptional regulators
VLEGLAARYAAEREVPRALLMRMRACVGELDAVVGNLSADVDQSDYVRLNDEFHRLLIEASGSAMVARSLDRIKALPFATPNAFVQSLALDHGSVRKVLIMAQEQHRAIVEAIAHGHGARAQSLAHEHSFCAARYLELLQDRSEPIPWVGTGD